MKRVGHRIFRASSLFDFILRKKFILWAFLINFSGQSYSQFIPNPDKAQLVFYNNYGFLWRTEKSLETVNSRPSTVVTFYFQDKLSEPAQFLYRDTIGMISRFNPIWIDKKGTVVAWDGFFSYLSNGSVITPDLDSQKIPNSLYYPVLCGISEKGVLLLAQNEQSITNFNEAAYFVPWSNDNKLLDFQKAIRFTDSIGVPFFSTVIKWNDNLIISWRPPILFCYDLNKSELDSFKVETHAFPGGYDESSVSQLAFFDGEIVLINHYGEKIGFDLTSRKQFALSYEGNLQWLARKSELVYAVRQAVHGDSIGYGLISFDLKNRKVSDILSFRTDEIIGEIGLPVFVLLSNNLIIWTRHQWKWLKL